MRIRYVPAQNETLYLAEVVVAGSLHGNLSPTMNRFAVTTLWQCIALGSAAGTRKHSEQVQIDKTAPLLGAEMSDFSQVHGAQKRTL
jgi:hypothetical protein